MKILALTNKNINLKNHNLEITTNQQFARQRFKMGSFDVVILENAEFLMYVRNLSKDVPIIVFLNNDTQQERLDYLHIGADVCCNEEEIKETLEARIRSLFRRSNDRATDTILHKNIELNIKERKVLLNNIPVRLTPFEFNLLHLLLENIGIVLKKKAIKNKIYTGKTFTLSNNIDVHIHNLRKKLGKDLITSVKCVGYVIKCRQEG